MGSGFECAAGKAGLTDDRHQRTDTQLLVGRYRNRRCSLGQLRLHHDVAASPAYLNKTVQRQDCAHLLPESRRSLANRDFELGHVDLSPHPATLFLRWRRLKK